MDRLIYLFGALLMSGGIVVLLGITPEVMTQDIMSLLSRQRSLKYLVAKDQGKVRRSRLLLTPPNGTSHSNKKLIQSADEFIVNIEFLNKLAVQIFRFMNLDPVNQGI